MPPNEKITSSTRLGFIGLGHLGSRIARRLVAAGFPMVVYDRDPAKAAQFSGLKAQVARGPTELACNVEVVMSCLPSDSAVEATYLGSENVMENRGSFRAVIEMSTITPETSQRVHEAAQKRGIPALDVAVSGSTLAAESGTLTLFGGGERADFDAGAADLQHDRESVVSYGARRIWCGMKLVVNTLLGLGMEAIAEALALGGGLGLPRELLFDALAKTAVVAPAHKGKIASAKWEDYTPQFPLRLMQKDFGLILNEAARVGVSMPATEAAAINFDEAGSDREEDFSIVVRRMEQTAKADRVVTQPA